jgi:hypothetical protein
MAIMNLTQHRATPDQVAAGVFDLPEDERRHLMSLLTFSDLPSKDEIKERANEVAALAALLADGADREERSHNDMGGFALHGMIGGAPFMMRALEDALKDQGIEPLYSFSIRESVEETRDGSVIKQNVFRHIGFVEPCAEFWSDGREDSAEDQAFFNR